MKKNILNTNKIDISSDNFYIKPYNCKSNVIIIEDKKSEENDINNIIKTLTSIIMSSENHNIINKKESINTNMSLFKLVANNKIDEIDKIVNNNDVDINIQDNDGDTPLHIAVFMCNINICKILLDNNANVYIKDKWGQTALHRICFCIGDTNIFKIINYFSKCSNDIFNVTDNFGNTPFHLVLKYMLKNSININEHHIKIINVLKKLTNCKITNHDNYNINDLIKLLNL